jgi:hypothetical protein
VRKVLDEHEAYTVIRYTDDENNRVGYQCTCGAEDEPDGELWGRSWLVNHQTQEIVKAL